jgi:hypothetical protein
MKLTPDQRGALRALHDHGGEGVITRTGTLLAGGEELAHDDGPQPQKFHSVTWLRLVAAGHVERRGDGRLGLTASGVDEAMR